MLFPSRDIDLVNWINQFVRAFEKYSASLGFSAGEVAGVKNDAAMLNYLVSIDIPEYEKALSKRRAYKHLVKYGPVGMPREIIPEPPVPVAIPDEVEPGILPRLEKLILRIESSPTFTKAMSEEFRLVGGGEGFGLEIATAKPTGRAIGQPDNEVRVEFSKSAFDGVLIESRRTGQDEWRKLATDNFSPYVDSRPLIRGGKPEVREYRMRFLMSDEPVGEWSDILIATASA